MAKKSNRGKDEDVLLNKAARMAERITNNPGYCRICGKELLKFDQDQDMYRWELQNQVHIRCKRRRAWV